MKKRAKWCLLTMNQEVASLNLAECINSGKVVEEWQPFYYSNSILSLSITSLIALATP
jgi:hypothetical protein